MTTTALAQGNLVKVVALLAMFLVLILLLVQGRRGLSLTRGNAAIGFGFLVVLAHYLFVGTSVTGDNTLILGFGVELGVFGLGLGRLYAPERVLASLSSLMLVFAVGFIAVNLAVLGLLRGEAFVEGNFLGVSANPNMLGGYVAIVCVPPVLMRIPGASASSKVWLGLALLLLLFLLMLSRSRASLIVVAAVLLYFGVTLQHVSRRNKMVLMAIVLALSASALLVIGRKYEGTELFSTRSVLLLQRVEAIYERPALGWGFNSDVFSDRNPKDVFPPMEKGNTVLQVFEEFGVPLGILLLAGLGRIILRSVRSLGESRDGRVLAAVLVGSSIHLMFETWLFNFFAILSVLFWLTVILANCAVSPQFRPAGIPIRT